MQGLDRKSKSSYNLNQKINQNNKANIDFFQNVEKSTGTSFSDASSLNIHDIIFDQSDSTDKSKINETNENDEGLSFELNSSSSYISKAQTNWEKKLIKSLNTICIEFNIPLAKKRNPNESQEIKRLWNELGTNVSDIKKFRPVFMITELLEHILSIKCNNLTDLAIQSLTGLINVPIRIKTLVEIKKQYRNLSLDYFQSGLDENLSSIIELERLKLGQRVVEKNDVILSREFSKQGCTKSLRAKLWSQMLDVNLTQMDTVYYNYLKQCVLDYDLLIDNIYYKDVKMFPVNDDQVFVFEDLLYQVLLLFSRDTHILRCFEKYGVQVPKGNLKPKSSNDLNKLVNYPPNGYLPFDGFSMLVAPICYVYNDPVLLYFIFRKLFMTHFHKLNIISSDPQCIMGLCFLFENIFQCKDAELFFHLRRNDVQPMNIVFKWIIRGFSGYLASSQLLDLWDRVLAFNSLEILSVFAVGVFLYRKQNIMSVSTKSNVESILDDLTSLKVVAILQLVLI